MAWQLWLSVLKNLLCCTRSTEESVRTFVDWRGKGCCCLLLYNCLPPSRSILCARRDTKAPLVSVWKARAWDKRFIDMVTISHGEVEVQVVSLVTIVTHFDAMQVIIWGDRRVVLQLRPRRSLICRYFSFQAHALYTYILTQLYLNVYWVMHERKPLVEFVVF